MFRVTAVFVVLCVAWTAGGQEPAAGSFRANGDGRVHTLRTTFS